MAKAHKNVSFSLGIHNRSFIEKQVLTGRFGNKTEAVKAGLRLLKDYENKKKVALLKNEWVNSKLLCKFIIGGAE